MKRSEGEIRGTEAFLANIARRLGRQQPLIAAPDHPVTGVPEFYREVRLSKDEQIQLFTKNLTVLTGKVLVVKQSEASEAIAAWVLEICKELEVTKIAKHDHLRLNELNLEQVIEEVGIRIVNWKATDTYRFPEERL